MPLMGTMLPPAQAAIVGESSGEDAPSNPQTVPATITEPDHSHDHASTPPRPTTTTSDAPVNESSAPPEVFKPHILGGAEDLDKLTALSSLVSTLVQKVNTQESELNVHKLLFKEVVGKLVKKAKLLEDKLKGRKRKFVLTDSDKEEDVEQDVDPLIKLAKAAATAAAASAVPTGGSHEADILPSSSIPSDEFAGGSDVPAGATTSPSVDPSNKGKSPLLEEDPPVRERTFRQREEDKLGEEAARRMYEEEQDELEREREEMQRKRQQDVLNSAKYYTDSDWTNIMRQVHANQGLTADLLGPDVTKDNFAERMVTLIAKRRREFAVQRFKDKLNKPMTYAQQKAFMRTFVKNQSSAIYTTRWNMKHVSKSTKAPKSNVPADSQQPSMEVPSQKATIEDVEVPSNTASTTQHTSSSVKKVGTKKKRLGHKGVHPSHSTIPIEDGDPEAEHKMCLKYTEIRAKHKMCIKYASDADSASDDDTPVNLYVVVDWELLPTGLGSINVFYRKDNSRKCFTSLREILHLVLMDSPEVNDGSDVWKNQHTWSIQSWKLYSYSGVHVLETVSGLVVHMFVDKKYPLSVNLIERMLDHRLEICHGSVGNELTTAVQLIAFLKKQISDSRRPKLVVNGFCLLENLGFWYTLWDWITWFFKLQMSNLVFRLIFVFLLPARTDVGLFLLPAGTDAAFGTNEGICVTLFHIGGFTFPLKEKLEASLVELGCWSAVSDIIWKVTELGAEAKGSLVLELEDLTLETQDAKPVDFGTNR
ncbi:hypothetical protein Tco_0904088 [Tanacetum coccineum]